MAFSSTMSNHCLLQLSISVSGEPESLLPFTPPFATSRHHPRSQDLHSCFPYFGGLYPINFAQNRQFQTFQTFLDVNPRLSNWTPLHATPFLNADPQCYQTGAKLNGTNPDPFLLYSELLSLL
ncbi:hypothetical protein FS749_004172 [Ceratobasidium sp. UAMH 11750]|nr:hypothetical protein FS749_004172 [Ceratobasidium sp. UAMH 11750]